MRCAILSDTGMSISRHVEMCNLLQQILAETGYVAKPSLDQWLLGLTNSYATCPGACQAACGISPSSPADSKLLSGRVNPWETK